MKNNHTMCDLKPGHSASVKELYSHGALRRRLFDIGIVPGTQISCVGVSPLGDPKAFLVRGMVVAIRHEDACQIAVEHIVH